MNSDKSYSDFIDYLDTIKNQKIKVEKEPETPKEEQLESIEEKKIFINIDNEKKPTKDTLLNKKNKEDTIKEKNKENTIKEKNKQYNINKKNKKEEDDDFLFKQLEKELNNEFRKKNFESDQESISSSDRKLEKNNKKIEENSELCKIELDKLFEEELIKKMYGEKKPKEKQESEKEKKHRIDKLKYESKKFYKECINESIIGFNMEKKLCILDMERLIERIKKYNSHKIQNFILYRRKNSWYSLTNKEMKKLETDDKFLKICQNHFSIGKEEESDKFRKIINGYRYRCCRKIFLLHKTVTPENFGDDIEIVYCTRYKDEEK